MGCLRFLWLLFLLQIIFLSTDLTIAQPDFRSYACDRGNYTDNSIYRSNLDTALSSITSNINTTIYGFSNTSVGKNSDTVNALALCRGDVDQITCGQCVYNSILKLRELCPNQKEARGSYDLCMLRYSDRSILQNMEASPSVYIWITSNVSNVDQFNEDLRTLLGTLIQQASGGGPLRKFATGNVSSADFMTIYGLVQCTPNLSYSDCDSCLSGAAREILGCCGGKPDAWVLKPSCNMLYKINPFFSETPMEATPPVLKK